MVIFFCFHSCSELSDEPGSHCFGAIRDGVFDGQIHSASDGIYYIERANRYFDTPDLQHEDNTTTSKFHSVIYHEKHLVDPFHHSKKGTYINNEYDTPTESLV